MWIAEALMAQVDHLYPAPCSTVTRYDDEDFWAGPDDTWPGEKTAEIRCEPEVLTSQQWGLRLPSGEIVWDIWQGIDFDNPLDRMRMVATLQKTALDIGFGEGQIGEFLKHYTWELREQIRHVYYGKMTSYQMLDSHVSEPADA